MDNQLLLEYKDISDDLQGLTKIERFARRLPVQIEFIDHAIKETEEKEGAILELGLGGGRTLEYLEKKTVAPIIVFEREGDLHLKDSRDTTQLVQGDFLEKIPQFVEEQSLELRMVHADIGTKDYANDVERYDPLRKIIENILPSGGVVVCDRPLDFQGFTLLAHSHKAGWPYYLWKKE